MKYSGIFNAHVDNIYCLAVMNVNTVLLLACIHWQAETVLEYSWYVHLVVRALIIFHFRFEIDIYLKLTPICELLFFMYKTTCTKIY